MRSYVSSFLPQEKRAPLHIRRAFFDAHQEMDHTTAQLQAAADDLKRCLENVLHEEDLHQRAPSMTAALYQSLREPFEGRVGPRDSVILQWLHLAWNSADPALGCKKPAHYYAKFICLEEENSCLVAAAQIVPY